MVHKWPRLILAILMVLLVLIIYLVFSNMNNDKYLDQQWYLTEAFQAPRLSGSELSVDGEKWRKAVREVRIKHKATTADTVIAVIDTQIDWRHEDLKGREWINSNEIPNDGIDNDKNGFVDDYYGYNFLTNKGISDMSDKEVGIHGTAVAGIICANTGNNIGVEGIVGSANVKIMNIIILDPFTLKGDIHNLALAIKYAEQNGAEICNVSSNFKGDNPDVEKAIFNSNMLFIVSSGNNAPLGFSIDNNDNIPAKYNFDNVITVAGLTQEGRIDRQSNYGVKTVDVLAPGADIYSLQLADSYGYSGGTSLAAPMVSGVAALISQCKPNMTAKEIRTHVLSLALHDDEFAYKIHSGAYLDLHMIFSR